MAPGRLGRTVFLLVLASVFLQITLILKGINIQSALFPQKYERVLQLAPPANSEWKMRQSRGRIRASRTRLVICCLARNLDLAVLRRNQQTLEEIGQAFEDYVLLLMENDSSNSTREELLVWQSQNSKVLVLDCCDLGDCRCKLKSRTGYEIGLLASERFRQMAKFRNRYLQVVNSTYPDFDFLLVFDLDISGGIFLPGIFNSLSYDFDMVCAKGLMPLAGAFGLLSTMYDALAWVSADESFDRNRRLLVQYVRMSLISLSSKMGDPPFRIKSGFNGMAIYQLKSIRSSSYSSNRGCEHLGLHESMWQKGYTNMFCNPSMILYSGLQGPNNIKDYLKAVLQK